MATAGSIVVDLLARTATFETDMKRAEKRLHELKKEAETVGKTLGTIFATVAIASAALVKSAIDAADATGKLSQQTGTTVEALSALTYAAELSDVSQEELGASLIKLSKNMSDAASGTGEAVKGFNALGISVKNSDGSLKSSDQVLTEIAEKFAGFKDGAEKTALAVNLFGRSGAQLIPLLNAGAGGLAAMKEEAQRLGVVIGTETSQAAEQFNDNLTRLGAAVSGIGNRAAEDLLPVLNDVSEAFVELAKSETFISTTTAIVKGAISVLITIFQTLAVVGSDVGFVFLSVGREIGAWAAQIAALGRGDLKGFSAISDAVKADGVRARAELDKFQARVMAIGEPKYRDPRILGDPGSIADQAKAIGGGKPAAPRLPGNSAGSELMKQLDGQIKAIRAFAQQQAQGFEFANRYVESVYADGVVSLEEYFDTQQRIREAALQAQLAAIDKEIAAEQSARKKVTGTDRIAIDNKIADAVARRSAIVQTSSQEEILATRETERAVKGLGDSYDDLLVKMLELRGDTAGAAVIQNERAIEGARRLLTQAGRDPGLADQYGELLGKTTQLSQVQREYNVLLEQARTQEEAILLAAEQGGASEIETLRAVGAAREKSLEQLGKLVGQAQQLKATLGTPEAIQFADQLANAFKRATLEVDPLLTKIRDVSREMGETIAGGFEQAILQGKGFRDVLKGVFEDINRIVIRKLVTEPFAKSITDALGGTGSDGGILGGLFRAKTPAANKGGVDFQSINSGFASLQLQGIEPATTALMRLAQAAGSVGRPAGTSTGDFARLDRGATEEPTTGDFARADRAVGETADKATRSIDDLGSDALRAATGIAQMAEAAGQGSNALALLPSIVRAVEFAMSGSSSGGSSGGGVWGSLVNAAVGYFTGGKSSGSSTGTTGDFARMDRKMHDGGVVGKDLKAGERGPLRSNERRAVLEVGEEVVTKDDPRHRDNWRERRYHDGGIVGRAVANVYGRSTVAPRAEPERERTRDSARPIQINQTFPPSTSRSTIDQAAASAGAAVRKALARTR